MRCYLFLGEGSVGLFDGRRWPAPGGSTPWVTGQTNAPDAIRGYLVDDLPYWLDDELWVVELGGDIVRDARVIRASRGRLVRRVEAWDGATAHAMAQACSERARSIATCVLRREGHASEADALMACTDPDDIERTARRIAGALSGQLSDAAAYVADAFFYARDSPTPGGAAAVAAYISARSAGCADASGDYAGAFAAERAWQASWLREHAGLAPGAHV